MDHATGVPACRVPPRSDRRPSSAGYELRMRRSRQGQSADPAARGRRSAMAGRARSQGRLDRERSRLLFGRAEMVQGRSGQYLAGEIGFRRHRISALRRAERGQPARHVVQPYSRAFELEPGAAVRPAQQRRYRARLRRRHRSRRSACQIRGARRGIRIPSGLYAVRRRRAHRAGEKHVSAGRADLFSTARSSGRPAANICADRALDPATGRWRHRGGPSWPGRRCGRIRPR